MTFRRPCARSKVRLPPLFSTRSIGELTWPGLREKVENDGQYKEYLRELEPLREELGISLKEAMYPESKK
jgi:hypothetical protein